MNDFKSGAPQIWINFFREVYDHFFPQLRSCTNYKHLSALRKGKIIC